MKANNDCYILRKIADMNVLIPVGEAVVSFNGMVSLNESGVMLWRCMENDVSREELAKKLIQEYGVSRETALLDVDEFVSVLQKANCLK